MTVAEHFALEAQMLQPLRSSRSMRHGRWNAVSTASPGCVCASRSTRSRSDTPGGGCRSASAVSAQEKARSALTKTRG
jgi:hypothetical protein